MANPWDGIDTAEASKEPSPVKPWEGLNEGNASAPQPQRELAAEVGQQFRAGLAIDLPKMVGQAMEWMGAKGSRAAAVGEMLRTGAEQSEESPLNEDLKPQVEGAGIIRRALSTGARALGPSLSLVGPAAAAAPFGTAATVAVGAAGGFGLFGASQAKETYDKLVKAGVPEEEAQRAGYINLLIEGAGETIGTYFGAKLFGVAGKAVSKELSPVAATIANATDKSVWKPFAKQLAETTAVETATEFGQNYGEAAVEQAHGARENSTPWEQGVQGAEAALGMTALLAPFGLAGHVSRAKSNGRIADALQNPNASVADRTAASAIVFDDLAKVNKDAAAAWSENSALAIAAKAPIDLDESFAQKKDPVQKILSATSASEAINAALEPLHDTLALDAFQGGALSGHVAEGIVGRATTAAQEESARQTKAAQDQRVRDAQIAVSEVQRAKQVSGLPDAPFVLSDKEVAELGQRLHEIAAAQRTPAQQQAEGAEGTIAEQLSKARRIGESQNDYEARMRGEVPNASTVRSDQGGGTQVGQAQAGRGADRGGNVQQAPGAGVNANGTELREAGGNNQPGDVQARTGVAAAQAAAGAAQRAPEVSQGQPQAGPATGRSEVPRAAEAKSPSGTVVDVKQSPNAQTDVQRVRGSERADTAEVLPRLPRGEHAAQSSEAQRPLGGNAAARERALVRQRVLTKGETEEEALREVRRSEGANAPRGLQPAASGEVAVPEVSSSTARIFGKPVGDLTDAQLAVAANNHRMSAHREVAQTEIERRAALKEPEGKTYTPEEGAAKLGATVATKEETPVIARLSARVVEKAFGKKVVFIKGGESEGASFKSDPNKVYVNVNAKRKWQALIGHETTHALKRTNAKVYSALESAVNSAINDKAFTWAEEKYGERSEEIQNEEIVANVVGDQMHEPKFWLEVFKRTGDVNALFKAVTSTLDRMYTSITGAGRHGYNTKEFITDQKAVRSAVAKAYAAWQKGGRENISEKADGKTGSEVLQSKAADRGGADKTAGESSANPIVTARQAIAHDKENPLEESRKGFCHKLAWRKVFDGKGLRQVIGVVNGWPSAPQPRAPIKIWHSFAFDPKTGNIWEPISDRWYSPAAMKSFGFEPVASLTSEKASALALKTSMYPDQQIYSDNVKPLKGAESDWLQPGDYTPNWKVVGDSDALESKPDVTPEERQAALEKWAKDTKVVDADGDPRVVFHGTSKDEDFKAFRVGQRGTFFTENPEEASSFAWDNDAANTVTAIKEKKNTAARVIPVYLNIKNPFVPTGLDMQRYKFASSYAKEQRIIAWRAKGDGHDGIKFPDGVWVAFKPAQIKSAIGNRGTFDESKNNILESKPDYEAKAQDFRDRVNDAFPEGGDLDFTRGDARDDAWARGTISELGAKVVANRGSIYQIRWGTGQPRNGVWISETENGRYTIEPTDEGKGGYNSAVNGKFIGWDQTRTDAISRLNDSYEEEIAKGSVEDPTEKKNVLKGYKPYVVKTVAEGWQQLARTPGVFLSGRSNSKSIKTIFKELDKESLVSSVNLMHADAAESTWAVLFNNGKTAFVHENAVDKTAYVDAADFDKGSRLGTFLYPTAFTWARNNGLKLMVDPNGLTGVNTFRRTEQMLSAALKYDSTEFMSPIRSDDSGRNPQELWGWNDSPKSSKDDLNNIALLAIKGMKNTFSTAQTGIPAIVEDWRYNFKKQKFEDESGNEVGNDEFRKLAGHMLARHMGVGPTTIARAIFTNSLINEAPGFEKFIDGELKIPENLVLADEKEKRTIVLYSKPDYVNTPVAESAARKSGLYRVEKPMLDRVKEMMPTFGMRMKQGLVDQFAPIKELDYHAYMLARMSKGSDGALEAMFLYGKPFLEDGALNVSMKDGGLTKVLQRLQGEHDRFIAWIAGNRAAQLKTEGRERLFEDAEIDWLKNLNQGQMKDGKSRAALYAEVHKEFNAYSKSVLDIAEQQGLIDPESRAVWEKDFYVPFYRNMDAEVSGPTVKSGLVSQQAFKKLKGGKEELNDLLANTLQNWSHLLSSAMKNKAALSTMESAVAAGAAIEVPSEHYGKQMQIGKVLKALDNGNERYFVLEDPFLIDAISSLESMNFGTIGKAFGTMKRWLTVGVTANPAFKIRNLIRDSLSSIAVSDLSYNPLANIAGAWGDTAHETQARASLLASGGMIRFGTQLEGSRAEYTRDLIEAGVPADSIIDKEHKAVAMLKLLWEHYQEFGDRGENVNRAALYKQMRDEGKSHLEAAYAARDLLDFSMQGSFRSVRFLVQTVPFFNARLQGLYKIGKAAAENPQRMGAVLGAVGLASMALLLAYKDDDDWKKREEWDRDNFWWFKIGDKAFRIPKPFEVGAVGTFAERMLEYGVSNEMTGKRLASRLGSVLMDNLSMNPTPQIVKPLIELYANKDFFKSQPIETEGMKNLSPKERAGRSTSATAQLLGKQNVISPVQIDHVIRSYFGWLGTTATTVLDFGLRPTMGLPDRPASQLKDAFLVGNFAESLPTNSSRYITDFYDSSQKITQAYADWRHALEMYQPEKAKEIFEANKEDITLHGAQSTTNRQLMAYSKLEKVIEANKTMTPEEKRTRLNRLDELKGAAAKRYSDLVLRRRSGDGAGAQ